MAAGAWGMFAAGAVPAGWALVPVGLGAAAGWLAYLAVCLGAALIVYVAVELEKAWRRRNAAALAMDDPVR